MKIASHDSATGERPIWWCSPLTPFARTQNKDIYNQLKVGCTLFDIRVKKIGKAYHCAHGWWFTKRTFKEILDIILDFTLTNSQDIYITITFEGKTKNSKEFVNYIKPVMLLYESASNYFMHFGPVCSKYGTSTKGLKVKYDTLIPAKKNWLNGVKCKQAFLPLDGKNWQTYIPIPRLWKLFYFKEVKFNDEYYQYVDFL